MRLNTSICPDNIDSATGVVYDEGVERMVAMNRRVVALALYARPHRRGGHKNAKGRSPVA